MLHHVLLSCVLVAAQETDSGRLIRDAANWVAEQAIEPRSKRGVVFPEYAEEPDTIETSLYAGSAGVLVFLENAAAVLDDARLRKLADRTADGLRSTWSKGDRATAAAGLYTGDPGIGHAFLVRHRLRGDASSLKMAERVAASIVDRMKTADGAGSWGDSYDIISGAAGTLLFLLEVAEENEDRRLLAATRSVGHGLARAGVEDETGTWWPSGKGRTRHYPNFSHGTAGVAYALARVAEATGDEVCLDAARAGARWLLANAKKSREGLSWFHYSPDREDSFREGWCHGPSGTGRLFLFLGSLTGDATLTEAATRSRDWIMRKWTDPGDEGSRTRFYSPSLCCGAAGVADYFVDLWRATGEERYREYARQVGRELARLSKEDENGRKWTNYDRPDEDGVIFHGVSLMLGASGNALSLLRLATIDLAEDPIRHLPDRRVVATRTRAAARTPARPIARPKPRATQARKSDKLDKPDKTVARVTVPKPTHDGDAYVVLTNRSRKGDPYLAAASELAQWRGGTVLTDFDPENPAASIDDLRQLGARWVAIVLPPEEIDTNTQRRFLMAAARLDDDIFLDVGYGFITGTRRTPPLKMVRRAKALQEKGLDRRWMGTGVSTGIKCTVYPSAGDPTAKRAGFEGNNIYWSVREDDPDVLKFVKKQLPALKGGGVVDFSGNGDPEGIWLFSGQRNMKPEKHWPHEPKKVGYDPKGEMPRITAKMIARVDLRDTIVWSGVCHTASLHRVFLEGDIVSTFGTADGYTEYFIPEGRSVAKAVLDAGAAAYIAPMGANHGYRSIMESAEAFERQLRLGDIVRSTYNDVAMAQGRAPDLDLHTPDNEHVDRARGAVMYGGGANRVLFGDPAADLFRFDVEPAVQFDMFPLSGGDAGFRVEASVVHSNWWDWNMFATDQFGDRIRVVLELPGDAEAYDVTATARDPKGAEIEVGRVDAHVEHIDGRRLLHMQASTLRGQKFGDVRSSATFVVEEVRGGR